MALCTLSRPIITGDVHVHLYEHIDQGRVDCSFAIVKIQDQLNHFQLVLSPAHFEKRMIDMLLPEDRSLLDHASLDLFLRILADESGVDITRSQLNLPKAKRIHAQDMHRTLGRGYSNATPLTGSALRFSSAKGRPLQIVGRIVAESGSIPAECQINHHLDPILPVDTKKRFYAMSLAAQLIAIEFFQKQGIELVQKHGGDVSRHPIGQIAVTSPMLDTDDSLVSLEEKATPGRQQLLRQWGFQGPDEAQTPYPLQRHSYIMNASELSRLLNVLIEGTVSYKRIQNGEEIVVETTRKPGRR